MRKVVEALLARRGQEYREFYPVILDFDEEEIKRAFYGRSNASKEVQEMGSGFLDYEAEREILRLRRQMEQVFLQLASGLNRMIIRTNRPAYFEEFVQTMYEENGLMIQVEDKSFEPFPQNGFVIDFELWGKLEQQLFREDVFYLPIYRKPWEILQNLDILVPIGYNTVIVEGVITADAYEASDKFEGEFYRMT